MPRWLPMVGLSLALHFAPSMVDAEVRDREPVTETATFSMYCYWTGEATVGRVEGVVASRIGHWGGAEIVQVDFDPAVTDVETLATALEHQRSLYEIVVGDRQAREAMRAAAPSRSVRMARGTPEFIEPKHSLRTRHPELLALGLDERQAIALNAWSYFGGPMPDVLTEDQRQHLPSAAP